MSENHHSTPVGAIIASLFSWAVTLTITIQDIDIYMRVFCTAVGIITGILAGINWYWSIKKNKRMAKRDIPF